MASGRSNGHSKTKHYFGRHFIMISLFSVLFMIVLSGCSNKAADTPADESKVIPIENETEASADAVIELKEDSSENINKLFADYFSNLAKGDVEALGKIMVNTPDKDMIAKEIEYIEDYKNIKCYSISGLLKDSYIVYVYYEVKFKNIDTLAPSMIREYVCTNEDGTLYINNGTVDGEVASWLDEVNQSESASRLIGDVNTALTEAAKSDEKLTTLIAHLQEGAGSAEETTKESESAAESESAQESSSAAETETKAEETTKVSESSKEETTKAPESSKDETSKAKETSYKAYDEPVKRYAQANLNIRKKASADSKILGKLIAGDSITALGKTGKWTVVKYKGGKGYILTELLGKKKPDTGISFKSVNEEVEATQNVRMRKQPNANAEVVGTLPGGTKVTRTGYNSKWSKIVYDGQTVYVATEYLY